MASSVFFAVLLLAVIGSLCQVRACNFPPQFWCESEDIARQCDVYEQCSKSVWKNSNTLKFFPWLLRGKPMEMRGHADASAPVELGVYIESLCPDCREFITKQLFPTFQKVGDIMNITLIPYGNAREKKVGHHWEFTCQHGQEECVGNLIETCAISIVQNISEYLPFINCMESRSGDVKEVAKECAAHFPVPIEKILSCSESSRGNQLEHEMAVLTDKLQPPHTYVPWVTLFGVHTEKIQKLASTNLLKLVCDTYTGTKPAACKEHAHSVCERY